MRNRCDRSSFDIRAFFSIEEKSQNCDGNMRRLQGVGGEHSPTRLSGPLYEMDRKDLLVGNDFRAAMPQFHLVRATHAAPGQWAFRIPRAELSVMTGTVRFDRCQL
jgi:hypothetical protein